MSTFRICRCASCCKREEPRRKLPPYTIVYERQRLSYEPYKRQQQTQLRINELAKVKDKHSSNKPPPQPLDDSTSARVLKAINFRLWKRSVSDSQVTTGRQGKNRKFWCFKNSNERDYGGMDTDLDIAYKEYATKISTESQEKKQLQQQPQQQVQQQIQQQIQQQVQQQVQQKPPPKSRAPSRVSMEGQLLKFTNLMKGYQYRWFVLNTDAGTLDYFEKKEHKKRKARGSIHLEAAKISSSKGDAQTFIVSAANGEIFKLKARDAKERQVWVERIQATAEYHTAKLSKPTTCAATPVRQIVSIFDKDSKKIESGRRHSERSEAFMKAKYYYREAEDFCKHLDNIILERPMSAIYLKSDDVGKNLVNEYLLSVDRDLLLLKATSAATLQCINDCMNILQLAKVQLVQSTSPSSSMSTKPPELPYFTPFKLIPSGESLPNLDDEVQDQNIYEDKSMDKMDEHKSVILHLLSQLKLGMDLTKVVLPTFILERRSLLELFTDCMAHPNIFVIIPKIKDPESRFLAVLEWYLTSFHNGRVGSSAKKPYNPILGETFHCSWHIPGNASTANKEIIMTYTAEQVSHHPPVSAFYLECPQNRIRMNASIYTKSKFLGMSVGVSLVGKVHLHLGDHDEDYVFSLPSAYCRSILTVPWVELGDKVQLICEKTGYVANITFHTKPIYGGKLHVVTAEAKNVNTGEIICKVTGEWNSIFEFTYPANSNKQKPKVSKVVDIKTLKVYNKYVRPLEKQNAFESRKLWINVTNALTNNDVQKATEYKLQLENIQRKEEERYQSLKLEHEAKFFREVDGVWLYKTLPNDFASEIKK